MSHPCKSVGQDTFCVSYMYLSLRCERGKNRVNTRRWVSEHSPKSLIFLSSAVCILMNEHTFRTLVGRSTSFREEKKHWVVLGRAFRGLTGGFLLLRNFSVTISVSPHVCFTLV